MEQRLTFHEGIWDSLTDVLDYGRDFINHGVTGHPYDAICDLSDILKRLTTEAVELAHKPIEWGVAVGTLMVDAVDRMLPDDDENPYSTGECPCKNSLVHQLSYLDACCEMFPKISGVMLDGIKSFGD